MPVGKKADLRTAHPSSSGLLPQTATLCDMRPNARLLVAKSKQMGERREKVGSLGLLRCPLAVGAFGKAWQAKSLLLERERGVSTKAYCTESTTIYSTRVLI